MLSDTTSIIVPQKKLTETREKLFINNDSIACIENAYIFLSFDVVNSTSYKTVYADWPHIFELFYDVCIEKMKNIQNAETSRWEEWKTLGDEIIFYLKNPTPSEIETLLPDCYEILRIVKTNLEERTAYSANKLTAKATIWSATIRETTEEVSPDVTKDKTNSFGSKKTKNQNQDEIEKNKCYNISHIMLSKKDFLGPDIDTGFRLSKYSLHGVLVVEAKLAWIISEIITDQETKANLRIIALQKMKGVWSGRKYPIIWYSQSWEMESLLFYDDDEACMELFNKSMQSLISNTSKLNSVEKILRDANQMVYANDIKTRIETTEEPIEKNGEKTKQQPNKMSELHLVAVCLNEDKKVLLLKRTDERETMKGVWDFGCTFLQVNSSIQDSIKNGYKDKIGIEVDIGLEQIPIMYLDLELKKGKTPCFIFSAVVNKKQEAEIYLDSTKYSEHKWVTREEIENYQEWQSEKDRKIEENNIIVPGAKERFEKALLKIQE